MDLMEIRNNRAFPTVHALMLEPFKTIWEEDTTERKEHAIKLFTYVEFMCSPKKSNAFMGYGEDIRGLRVKKEVYGDETIESTEWMMLAVVRYKELLSEASPTYELLETGLKTKDKLIKYLQDANFSERTPNGTAVIKPKEVIDALKQIPGITNDLIASRDKVQFELAENTKTRNQREIGDYER